MCFGVKICFFIVIGRLVEILIVFEGNIILMVLNIKGECFWRFCLRLVFIR